MGIPKSVVQGWLKKSDEAKPKRKAVKRPKPSYALFFAMLARAGVAQPELEYQFHETRKWRFDMVWRDCKLALEIDGGVWINGGHNRGSGYERDTEKRNEAAILGWRLIRCQPKDIQTGRIVPTIKAAIEVPKLLKEV